MHIRYRCCVVHFLLWGLALDLFHIEDLKKHMTKGPCLLFVQELIKRCATGLAHVRHCKILQGAAWTN
eukprot:5317606-Amphidinium_carterae.2